MITKKLKIQLLSDLCSGSGDTYNTSVDTDIVYDDFGLPYIPAKRIKGCIRESLLELVDFGRSSSSESYKALFGSLDSEDEPSGFELSNAYLEGYENMKAALSKERWHPQDVLELYTYSREQTSIDPRSGSADKNTLRTTRVVGRDNCFESVVKIKDETFFSDFEMAAKNVVHMGINRTRGLGLVHITLEDYTPSHNTDMFQPTISFQDEKKYILSYSILLKSAVICKSPEGNCGKTQPYIEGSKVLGIIAGKMQKKDFLDFMKTDPIFATAYIADGVNRATPVSVSVRKEKNSSFVDGKMDAFDFFDGRKEDTDSIDTDSEKERIPRQYSGLGTAFLTQDNHLLEVDTEISYHHQRPDDKSIGRATDTSGAFYQLESIRQDQVFAGYIKGTKETMQAILRCLENKRITPCRIGFSKQTQFGEAEFTLLDLTEESDVFSSSSDEPSRTYIVRLNSPAILYDKNGMYSSDKNCFKDYLESYLFSEDTGTLTMENAVMTYETIGGYNVTQRCRKPIIRAIGRGSIFCISSTCPISCDKHSFIGERTNEGFGEIEILRPCENINRTLSKGTGTFITTSGISSDIISRLKENQYKKKSVYSARKEAQEMFAKTEIDIDKLKVAVNKLILMYKSKNKLDEIKKEVIDIKEESKRKAANQILNINEKTLNTDSKDFYKVFLKTYLNEWKILIRQKSNEEGNV